jgi:hypothetical protein
MNGTYIPLGNFLIGATTLFTGVLKAMAAFSNDFLSLMANTGDNHPL